MRAGKCGAASDSVHGAGRGEAGADRFVFTSRSGIAGVRVRVRVRGGARRSGAGLTPSADPPICHTKQVGRGIVQHVEYKKYIFSRKRTLKRGTLGVDISCKPCFTWEPFLHEGDGGDLLESQLQQGDHRLELALQRGTQKVKGEFVFLCPLIFLARLMNGATALPREQDRFFTRCAGGGFTKIGKSG